MRRIVCVGECMVEFAPIEGQSYRRGFAGDTFNSAWYLRRILPEEWAVDYVSCVGTDAISDEMIGFMAAAGVGTAGIRRVPDRTVGLYTISLHDGERSFTYWRSASAARSLAADAGWLGDQLAGADTLLFSGITLAILPPEGRLVLLDRLRHARSTGATVVFDPNIRLHLWPDADAARHAIAAAAAVSDLVVPSFEDDALLFGDADPEVTIARYRAAGATSVVVKNGPGQIVAWSDREGLSSLHPPGVKVVDTTAAGDSFNAGLLAARARGASLAAAIDSGAHLAGHVCGAAGALVPLP